MQIYILSAYYYYYCHSVLGKIQKKVQYKVHITTLHSSTNNTIALKLPNGCNFNDPNTPMEQLFTPLLCQFLTRCDDRGYEPYGL